MMLQIDGLRKDYAGPDGAVHRILDIPAFAMADREQVALRGESGSGKTTFLHCICGILKPDAGSITVAGHVMTQLGEAGRDRARAAHIGYIFQTFNLLQGHTALENVLLGMAFGRGEDRDAAAGLLERVGLGGRLHHLPRQLSTGQQQRVAVARALAGKPRLVLADEPTGNLDSLRAGEAMALIREVCSETGAGLLLVSHDPSVLSRFDNLRDFHELNRAVMRQEGAS